MTYRPRIPLVAVLTLVATAACQPEQHASPAAAEDYLALCAACHGRPAAGGGVAGLDPDGPAPDLTRLAAVNGGAYPTDRVIDIIDGRRQVRAHGSPMPVWGNRLSEERILLLTDYLATIQR